MLAPFALLALISATETKPSLSVLYFDNNTGKAELDVLRKGLADMIVTDLVAWDGVTVLEREKLESVLGELKLQQAKAFDAKTRQKLGKLLGAKYLLSGSMTAAGQTLAVDAQLIEVETGAIKVSARASGPGEKIFDLEQELVLKVTAGIDARLRDAGQRKKVKVPDLETLLQYSKALDLSDQGKLDEAQKAMQEVVSKSPGFLLAREKKKAILEHLKESELKRRDIISGSIVELNKIADAALNAGKKIEDLDETQGRNLLAMRVIKQRFLSRLLKQYLSSRDEGFRMVLLGKEKEARQVMEAWAENQRQVIRDYKTFEKLHTKFYNGIPAPPSTSVQLDPNVEALVRDARVDSISISSRGIFEYSYFVLRGHAKDGDKTYIYAPALGDLNSAAQKQALEMLDEAYADAIAEHAKAPVARQPIYVSEAGNLANEKADVLLRLDRDEEAVAAYQKFLDTFPAAPNAERFEKSIEEIVGAKHSHERSVRERWQKALETCDDMDIRVGSGTLARKLNRLGHAGLAAHAAELEKKCKLEKKTRSAFAYTYQNLGMSAARHEDCEGFRSWFTKYLNAGGSVSDMKGYQRNHVPWCELGEIAKSIAFMHSKLDENWELEMNDDLSSVLSNDKKKFFLNGRSDNSKARLSFVLEVKPDGKYECKSVRWERGIGGGVNDGTCEVEITKFATESGDWDEGKYTASFPDENGPMKRTMKLTHGVYRLKRH
jgi:TolB-like protein